MNIPRSESLISSSKPSSDTTLLEMDHLVRSATTESWKYVPNQRNAGKTVSNVDTRYNVENPQWWEKPRQPTGCKQSLYERKYNVEETQRQRPLVLILATHGSGYTVEATTSLSLSLTLCTTTLQ